MTILVCNKCNLPVIHPNLSGLHYFSKGFCQCQPERSKREDFYGECDECGHFLEPDGQCAACPHLKDAVL